MLKGEVHKNFNVFKAESGELKAESYFSKTNFIFAICFQSSAFRSPLKLMKFLKIRSPTSPDFSGWNCTAKKLSF
jgi:hypothetical protein